MSDIQKDLLSSSKALLDLDADGALVPHGLGGHGRTCLTWCVDEIERLRADNARLRGIIENVTSSWFDTNLGEEHMDGVMGEARAALKDGKDD